MSKARAPEMKIAVYSTSQYDRDYLSRANLAFGHELRFVEQALNLESADLAIASTFARSTEQFSARWIDGL